MEKPVNEPTAKAMDVVAGAPQPVPVAEAPADSEPATPPAPKAAPAPSIVTPKPAKQGDRAVTAAIIGTVVIVLCLAALATLAYLKG